MPTSQGGRIAGHKVDFLKVRSSRRSGELHWEEADETERLRVAPDAMFTLHFQERTPGSELAHFFYEADRGSMVIGDMLKKFRGYHHLIKRQQRHKEAFGVHPIRAVLVETTDEPRARRLMELAVHPLVCGASKRSSLFWLTTAMRSTARRVRKSTRPASPPNWDAIYSEGSFRVLRDDMVGYLKYTHNVSLNIGRESA